MGGEPGTLYRANSTHLIQAGGILETHSLAGFMVPEKAIFADYDAFIML